MRNFLSSYRGKMNRKKYLFPVLLAVSTGQCITSHYHDETVDYANPRHEFKSGKKTIPGHAVSRTDGSTDIYFADILEGKERLLKITTPPGVKDLHITDTYTAKTEGSDAYLVFVDVCCTDQDLFRELVLHNVGDRGKPLEILKQAGAESTKPADRITIVSLDESNIFTFSASVTTWKKEALDYVVESVHIEVGPYSKMSLPWRERSYVVFGLRQFGYPGTVLLDILTSPVQLLYLAAGPGAK
jgi:hypothetical protein